MCEKQPDEVLISIWPACCNMENIEAIYEKDPSLPIRSTPKLTEKHIHPNNFQKMKVKLAMQVLSHTVAASLCMHVSVGALPSTAMGTAEFIQKFDSVFDCVNRVLHCIPQKN